MGVFYTRESTTNQQMVNGFDTSTGAPLDLPPFGAIDVGPRIFKEMGRLGRSDLARDLAAEHPRGRRLDAVQSGD